MAAVGLILVSLYTDWLGPVRAQLGAVATPFYWVTNLPQRIGAWGDDTFASRQALSEENEALKSELLILQRKLQQMAALAALAAEGGDGEPAMVHTPQFSPDERALPVGLRLACHLLVEALRREPR